MPAKRTSEMKPTRVDDVDFQFLGPATDLSLTGSVLIRHGNMVIDIPKQPGSPPCLVEGRLIGHVYSGCNTLRQDEPPRIDARWSDLGGLQVFVI